MDISKWFGKAFSDPASGVFAITPNDSTIFDGEGSNKPPARSVYVGGAGNVSITAMDDTTATFTNVPPGVILPIHVKQVKATGTTATNILGLY